MNTKENNKISLFILFGLDAVHAYDQHTLGSTQKVEQEIEEKTGGCYEYIEMQFDTEAEKSAYIKGMNDMSGWGDYMILDRKLKF